MQLIGRTLWRMSLATTALSAIAVAAPTAAQAQLKDFNIPAQPLESALLEFSRQSDVLVVVSPELTAGKQSRPVRGPLPINAAITRLLSGTDLRAVPNSRGGFRVERNGGLGRTPISTAAASLSPASAVTEIQPAAAEAPTNSAQAPSSDSIVVTGYRRSLEDSAAAKKSATNFTDSIFAEDIGKFPDLNLAESLQRLPGVQIDRDVSGEGTYINVRGLSAGFTVLTLNGFAISTSSNGGNEGRGSALDILPSELFHRLTLSKSPVASGVEGGTAGSVDMQPARAFDRKGLHLNLQAQASYQDADKTKTPRFAAILSDTFENTPLGDFGILIAGAYAKKNYRSEIFNTVGYTTMNLGSACPSSRLGCNSLTIDPTKAPATNPTAGYGGGAGATLTRVPTSVPSELGLPAAGAPLVQCLNGAAGGTSGMSCQDLSYVIVPRLVRAEQVIGQRDRKTGMVNLEWRPTSRLRFKLDSILSKSNNNFGQHDVMLTVRSYNNNIPINFQADGDHVLTSGTFANSYFLNQSTDTKTFTKLFYRSLSAEWDIAPNLRASAAGMMNTGKFKNTPIQFTLQSAPPQTLPTVYAAGVTAPPNGTGGNSGGNATPLNTGQYVNYTYTPGDLTPHIAGNINLPTYTGWYWNSLQIAPTRQDLQQKAGRVDLVAGDAKTFQLSMGVMKSDFKRHITGWNTSDCAFRNNCTSVFTSTETSLLGAIPNSAIPQYLSPLPATDLFANAPFDPGFNGGWQVIDFNKVEQAVNFDYYINHLNPGTDPGNYLNTYSPRVLLENTTSGYMMADGRRKILGNELRFNLGVRVTRTTQSVAGIVNDFLIGGSSREAPATTSHSQRALPSANLVYFLTNNLLVRGAAARTITRPNPQDLAPTFGLSLDADTFTKGNPALKPFFANNYDVGVEWYPRSKSVLTMNLWWKTVFDYPATISASTPFPETGLIFSRLSTRQQTGVINLGNGDPNAARIIVVQKRNSDVAVNLFGQEFQWIQPLDFVVKGLGFNANVTHISQSLSGTVPPGFNPKSLIAGLAPWTYNATVYYERPRSFSVRLSYTHRDANLQQVCPCNNIPGDIYSIATNYMDAELTFPFPWYRRLVFTMQAQNLLKQVQLNRYENRESEPDGATYAGRVFVVGLRANF